jgi:hypothetical protein
MDYCLVCSNSTKRITLSLHFHQKLMQYGDLSVLSLNSKILRYLLLMAEGNFPLKEVR